MEGSTFHDTIAGMLLPPRREGPKRPTVHIVFFEKSRKYIPCMPEKITALVEALMNDGQARTSWAGITCPKCNALESDTNGGLSTPRIPGHN